jgi:predicted Rossmann-fold nucleotide-binding protein
VQTRKISRPILIVLYGSAYWNEVLDFDALARHEMIAREDLDLFQFADDPAAAFEILRAGLSVDPDPATPAFAGSRGPDR